MMNPGAIWKIVSRLFLLAVLLIPMFDFFSGTALVLAEENTGATSGRALPAGAEVGAAAVALPNGSAEADQALKICMAEREKAEAASAQFQAEAAQLRAARAAEVAEVEQLRHEVERVRAEHQEVQDRKGIIWFLAGGGIMLLGYLIGQAGGSSRRYKSTLLK